MKVMHALESLALIGLRGSGKTSLGKRLAKELDFVFFDTDEVFKNKQNQTIAEYVAAYGWEAFRDREEEILLEMPASKAIISCGGGIILRPACRMLLKQKFFTVFLDVSVQELVRRLSKDSNPGQRPAFTEKSLEEEMRELYEARIALYRETCAYRLCEWQDFEKEVQIILTEYAKKVKR